MTKSIFETDEPYNLSPFKYPWSYDRYKNARKRNWNPENIQMAADIEQFKNLSEIIKEAVLDTFATLTTADLVIQENISSRIYEIITAPELRLYLGEQLGQESLHSYTYQYIIEYLSLNDNDVYKRYLTKPAIAKKFEIANKYAKFLKPECSPIDKAIGLIFFYLGWEGIWFYHGFTFIFTLKRNGLMRGMAEQLEEIGVDESGHFEWGMELINTIIVEYKLKETHKEELISRAQEAMLDIIKGQKIYAEGCIPKNAVIGYSPEIDLAYTRFLANIRLSQINIPKIEFDKSICYNSLPWLDEVFTTRKEKNFFETRVFEYQTGANLGFDAIDGNFNLNSLTNWN